MLKRLVSIIAIGLLLISCSHNANQTNNDTVKMPYKEWRIGGRYPSYFTADIISIYMITQSNQFRGLRISAGPNNGDNPGQWDIYPNWPDALYVNADLPRRLNICWVSFVDQTFYRTEVEVPLAIRQQMVIPYKYKEPGTGNDALEYNDTIILGFAPGGNVTAWLAGAVREQWIEFAKVRSTNLGQNSPSCPNPYPDGKITEITPEAKAWLKKHGMPAYWQEKAD